MENNIANQEKKKEVITREMITKADGTLDISVVADLLKKGVKLEDLPLKVSYYMRTSVVEHNQETACDITRDFLLSMINYFTNWDFYKNYIDVGIKSKSKKKLQSFLNMREDAYDHKFDLIIVNDLRRFSSSISEAIEDTMDFMKNGVGVWFIDDNILTFEPSTQVTLTVISQVDQIMSRKRYEKRRTGNK